MNFDRTQRPMLPKSLRKKRIHSILGRCIVCFLLLAIMIFVIIMWGNRLFPISLQNQKGFKGLQITFYVFLLSLPFFISGVPLKLIDKSWQGTVTAIDVREGRDSYFLGGRLWPYTNHNLVLTIEKNDGTVFEYTAISLGVKANNCNNNYYNSGGKIYHQADDFSVGDRVYKYYGFKYLYVIHPNAQVCNCIVCGAKNNNSEEKCWNCRGDIIK